MEPWQAFHIQRNLNYLIKNTHCNYTFLAILQEKNVLSDNDYSRLEAKGKWDGRIAQSKLLYDLLTTRLGAYDALIEALSETRQTGSLQVLEKGFANGMRDYLSIQDLEISSNNSASSVSAQDLYSHLRLKWEREQESVGKLRWIPSHAASSRISELVQGGQEDEGISYVARAFHEGEWIPGKFFFGGDKLPKIYIAYYDVVYEYKDFQVLIAPPGATAWVEAEHKCIPKLAVCGGLDPAILEPTYICRVWHDGKLVLGKRLHKFDLCFIPYQGKEVELKTEFEILVYKI